MKNKKPSFLVPRAASIKYAFCGLGHTIRTQTNFRFQLLVGVLVILSGILLKITTAEWVLLVLAIVLVLAAETFNTAIELLVDKISPGHDRTAGLIKDISAGAVLIVTMGAIATGIFIFGPRILW